MNNENPYSNDNYDLLIYKFLNYSSNSIFYGILAIGVFAAAIFNTTTIFDNELFNQTLSIILMLVMSTLAGLVWWRQAVNRQQYKTILKLLINNSEGTTDETKAEKVMTSLREHKTTMLERLRQARLTLVMMITFYLIIISFNISNSINSNETNLLDATNLVLYSIGGLTIVSIVILSFIINSKYKKDLLTENYVLSSSDSKPSG